MITKDNFKDTILSIGFEEQESGVYLKNIHQTLSSQMRVDFNNERLEYAVGIKADRDTTKDFHQSENFVVFECVCRLLEQGYAATNIVLEASAGADGRGQTNTYLDILVKDYDGNNYLIIECKTADGSSDDEFSKAWRKVLHDGGQLFNYFTLFRTPHLCLYGSDFVDGHIKRYSNLIILKDENIQYLTDTGKEGYRDLNATSGQNDYFRVWQNTYEQAFLSTGIFNDGAKPYEISTKITRTFDELAEMDDYQEIQRKYNEFATIMRQHNVGSHENAFDKLVNLFLAKIVDEESNKSNLKFNWKTVAFDDYYNFQDRLQELYTHGMKKFLGEEVTYINEENIQRAFEWIRNSPDATRDKIIDYFRQLKFYSNNDFAFLDVHNKELFLKNMEILIKIVQMLQDIRLKSEHENQFLGDLFEGFLDSGVKQSEGQFFTPIPIVKFLISSLPVESIIKENDEAPWVIDYACGAGHFLNEVARQIRPHAEKYNSEKSISEFYSRIVGIEKEYRLSKVAKVSAFMYSQDDIKIIYGDALAGNHDIKDGTFQILVANPPYSVKGFLETLTDEERHRYSLFNDDLNLEKNNSIETFFIERAAQLMAPGGVCAIILPSSVLSNGGIYVACREIILKHFDMVAIAEFGSGTFGKTGTNTVTLFMRRKVHEVDAANHLKHRAETWLKGDFSNDGVFKDAHLLEEYCYHCSLDVTEYRSWCCGGNMPNTEIFDDYQKVAENQTRYKNILKKRLTVRYTAEQKAGELEAFVIKFIKETEQDKLYCYLLATDVSQPVVIVKSPTDNKAIKTFLGYEWSGAKGSEGIKYLGQMVNDEENQLSKSKGLQGIKTPLFDPKDYNNPDKINMIIRRNFQGETSLENVHESVKYARLVDMIDFTRVTMDKAIRTNVNSKIEIVSKWPLISFAEIVSVIETGSRPIGGVGILSTGILSLGGEHIDNFTGYLNLKEQKYVSEEFYRAANRGKVKSGDLLICKDGALTGKVALVRNELANKEAMVNEHVFIVRCQNMETQTYLFHFLYSIIGQQLLKDNITGSAQGGLNSSNLRALQLPLPPLSVQQQIVDECTAVDNEVVASNQTINDLKAKIENVIANVEGESKKLKEVAPFKSERIPYTNIEPCSYISTDNILQDFCGVTKYEGTPNINSVIAYNEGDILLSNIRPYLKKIWYADTNGGCNPDVLVLRPNDSIKSKFVYYSLRRQAFFDYVMTDVKGVKMPRGKKEVIDRFSITIPSLTIQQQIISEIETYEARIAEAKQVVGNANARKQAILDKYLK